MNIGNGLKAAKTVVTSKAGRTLLKGQKHSPTILFGTGVIGVVATAVLASKATLRLEEVLEENERKLGEAQDLRELNRIDEKDGITEREYKKDVAVLKVRMCKDVARLYAPTIVVGAVTVGAMGGSHYILNNRLAGVTAAYAALDRGFKEYQDRVRGMLGEDVERELRFGSETREVAEDTENGTEVKTIKHADIPGASKYAKIFSKETSTSWSPQPEYNLVFLRAQQQYANDMLRAKGHIFLNEIYDSLGLDRTPAGAVTGWVWNNKRANNGDGGDNFVDFGIFDHPDRFHDFVTGREGAILLDFNVDGIVYDLI